MKRIFIFLILILMFSCVNIEKKYEEFKINQEITNYGQIGSQEIAKGVTVQKYNGKSDYSDLGLKGLYLDEDELTFTMWICPSEIQKAPLIDNQSIMLWLWNDKVSFKIQYMNNSKLESKVLGSETKYKPNEWLSVTGVYKKNNYIKLYVNGKLESQKNGIGIGYGQGLESKTYLLGHNEHSGGKSFYKGLIDTSKTMIYNKEITEKDIKSYYNSTKGRYGVK